MKIAKPERNGFDPARLNRIDAFLKEQYLDSGLFANAGSAAIRARNSRPSSGS